MWLPGAICKPLKINYTPHPRKVTNAVILHVAVSESPSLYGWFSNPKARASSHFYVRKDGTIEQYIPINLTSWAGVRSDLRAISVETQGMAHGTWSEAQLEAMAKIISFCQDHYPIPTRIMTSSKPSEAGIGYHSLGVPANYHQKAIRRSQTGGELWSGAVGKVCPGFDRIPQIPDILARLEPENTPVQELLAPYKKENNMKNVGIHWRGTDGRHYAAVFNPISGFWVTLSSRPGRTLSGKNNTALAKAYDTPNWAEVSETYAHKIKTACENLRKGI